MFTKVLGGTGAHPHSNRAGAIPDVVDTSLNECVCIKASEIQSCWLCPASLKILVVSWLLTQPALPLIALASPAGILYS